MWWWWFTHTPVFFLHITFKIHQCGSRSVFANSYRWTRWRPWFPSTPAEWKWWTNRLMSWSSLGGGLNNHHHKLGGFPCPRSAHSPSPQRSQKHSNGLISRPTPCSPSTQRWNPPSGAVSPGRRTISIGPLALMLKSREMVEKSALQNKSLHNMLFNIYFHSYNQLWFHFLINTYDNLRCIT